MLLRMRITMENNRRNVNFCPNHPKAFVVRQNNHLVCVGFGCTWKVEAKRNTDKNIPDMNFIKTEFNG